MQAHNFDMKKFKSSNLIVLGTVFIGFLLVGKYVQAIPTETPPQGNRDYPINLSDEYQIKEGALILNTGDSAGGISPAQIGFKLFQGKMGVGVGIGNNAVSPNLNVEVAGKIGASQYCNRDGSNCISIDQANSVESSLPNGFIPSGAIFMFLGTCPSGFPYFAAIENRFPRGTPDNELAGASGGQKEHSHALQHNTVNTLHGPRTNEDNNLPRAYLQNASNLPPLVNVVFCKKT